MPMIDVYAPAGTFEKKHGLARDLASAVMRWEGVPEIPLFADNTAAFIHDLPAEAISNVAGRGDYVRVLTPAGVLDRDKQLGVVKELTEIIARAAGDSAIAQRTWASRPPQRGRLQHRAARGRLRRPLRRPLAGRRSDLGLARDGGRRRAQLRPRDRRLQL